MTASWLWFLLRVVHHSQQERPRQLRPRQAVGAFVERHHKSITNR